jgi:uncharacterized membrane protein
VKSFAICANLATARFVLALSWAGLIAGICAAPLLAAHSHPTAAGLLYVSFGQVCHQMPERSFYLQGHPLAVCHRCSGIYLGLLAGSLLPGRIFSRLLFVPRRRWWVIAGAAPLVLDALAPWAGFWANTPLSRASTGVLFGIMIVSLLQAAAQELFDRGIQPAFSASHVRGGFS